MKVLLVGGGGREHAIAWKLKQSPRVSRLYCAPGNGGIASLADLVAIKATDLPGIVQFARDEKIDLVFVAPDDPLALGLVDELAAAGIRAFGPTRAAARIEASKAFAKDLMHRYNIPTADFHVFRDLDPALAHIAQAKPPIVVKADGLALGKGVIIAPSREEAALAVRRMMADEAFGKAGRTVVIEQYLQGPELTVLAFTDGKTICPMVSSRDHKRALDGDKGLNTGGMGAIAPGAELDAAAWEGLQKDILEPTILALRNEGHPFKGVIYFGLMLTEDGPKVIEYNARFGDPEAQAVLPLLENDLIEVIDAVIDEHLDQIQLGWRQQSSCCVVMASGGYPESYETGFAIEGLEQVDTDCLVFHAGTRRNPVPDGRIVTAGGRVLGVTAMAPTLNEAIAKAYENVGRISFKQMHYRRDIGKT